MTDEEGVPEVPEEPSPSRVEISIPFGTIVKVLVTAVVVLAVIKLWLPFLVFLVAVDWKRLFRRSTGLSRT